VIQMKRRTSGVRRGMCMMRFSYSFVDLVGLNLR
jgi:hypothetical protein